MRADEVTPEVEKQISFVAKAVANIIYLALNGVVVLITWNAFLVHLFPVVPVVNYIQAVGLTLLSKTLFASEKIS
jgi:hypothetical protein